MPGLADFLSNAHLDARGDPLPAVMAGEITDTDPLRVVIPTLDGGRTAYQAFGTWPDANAGDPVRVALDELGGVTVLAWQAA